MTELNIYQNRANPTEPILNVSVEWVTQITENRSGKENRIPKITEPQYTIEGSDFVLRDDDYDVFVDAFLDAEGKNNAFPFKCPLDYYCSTGEVYDTNNFQRGILVPIDSLNYQIVKQYSVGGVSTYKSILLPVDDTIHVYEGDTEVFPSVNLSTGVVTFASPPTDTLKIECEFRLPMRFDVDDNQLNQIKRAVNSIYSANDTSIYLAVNFRLVEDMNYIRKSPLNSSDWQSNLTYNFDGNPLADVAYSERSLTRIQSSDNKRELRDGLGIFRKKYAIANNNMDWNKTQKYFTLFMACKGRLLPFTFEGSLVRLDSDVFNASMIGYNNVFLDEEEFSFCSPRTVILTESLNSNNLTFIEQIPIFGAISGSSREFTSEEIANLQQTMTYHPTGGIDGGRWVESFIEYGGDDDSVQYGVLTYYMTNLSYTPQSADEIITIAFEIAIKNIAESQTFPGLAVKAVINQSGTYKDGSAVSISNPPVGGAWTAYSGSFTLASLGLSPITGVPLHLGIMRQSFGNLPGGGAGIYSSTIGIDLLSYTVTVDCP